MSRRTRPVAASVAAVLAIGTLTCCTACARSKGSDPGAIPVIRCGATSTAVGVPVDINVERGSVPCKVALTVERNYSRAVAAGKVRGNGGGSPVTIDGWTCQGYDTPVVDRTGNTSACKKDSQEILAVLPPVGTSSPSNP